MQSVSLQYPWFSWEIGVCWNSVTSEKQYAAADGSEKSDCWKGANEAIKISHAISEPFFLFLLGPWLGETLVLHRAICLSSRKWLRLGEKKWKKTGAFEEKITEGLRAKPLPSHLVRYTIAQMNSRNIVALNTWDEAKLASWGFWFSVWAPALFYASYLGFRRRKSCFFVRSNLEVNVTLERDWPSSLRCDQF